MLRIVAELIQFHQKIKQPKYIFSNLMSIWIFDW